MTSRDIALEAALEAAERRCPLQDVLSRRLSESGLDSRDRALAEEVAFGALRRRLSLHLALGRVVSRPIAKMQPALAEALRQGAYQMLFLDRVPARAAVSETVELVKARLGRKPSGMANAVLRSLARLITGKGVRAEDLADPQAALASREGLFTTLSGALLPDPAAGEAAWLAGAYGYPKWMVERWLARHGRERAERILEWGNTPPPLSARVNRARLPEWPLSDGDAAHTFRRCRDFAPGEVPGTYRITPEVAPGELPGLAEGLFTIQDETQVRPAHILSAPQGGRVLDLCAGLGTKATQLAEMVGPGGSVVALERDAAKLGKAREAATRLGLENIEFLEGDALSPPDAARGPFDHVLLDAPCSNLGALDRRPEVRFRAGLAALATLTATEIELLAASFARVAPGGALVYSVCSFEAEEGPELVRAALEEEAGFALESESTVLPEPGARDGGYAARIVRETGGAP
ncbi:MAG: transcription antitermination factor NusB [Planctomycetota bacterium]|jgi:16S rRNA (cytosine967-C5)-methyltransferase